MIYRIFQVNAFSRKPDGGNPVGVVLEADGLSDEEMRTLAGSHDAPDTVFVYRARGDGHDAALRFLTPHREAPFIGHATLASQYVLASLGDASGRRRLQTGAGIVEAEILRAAGDYRIALTQNGPVLGALFPERHIPAVLDALSLSREGLHPDYPPQLVPGRSPRLLMGVRSVRELAALKPDFEALKRLSPQVGADGYFIFTLDRQDSTPQTYSRLFCPAIGIPEDPVSANTHAMLGIYLLSHGLLQSVSGTIGFRGHQGQWMGRAGTIDLEVLSSIDTHSTVRIVGDAVITQRKTVEL